RHDEIQDAVEMRLSDCVHHLVERRPAAGALPRRRVLASAAVAFAARKLPDVLGAAKEKGSESAEGALSKVGEEGSKRAQEALQNAGGGGGIVGAVASKAFGGGGGGKGGETKGKTRRLPIQRWTDVAVPVERAYEAWKSFEDYPKFMHRVLSVEPGDDNTITWNEKIWFSKRNWKAEIIDDRPNERIAWKTVSGTAHSGVVTFHRLEDNLTRVMVTMDFRPAGMIEKMASGLRFVKRAVQADLARFKAYVEFEESDVEGGPKEQGEKEQQKQQDDERDEQPRGESAEESQPQDEHAADAPRGLDDDDDEDREAARREREERREQRREHAAA
ncbi:MAG: SRPBCC family protein, partial [Actinomycetota bacterium]|nr:SRPBCC family protein [Actinomycetota bacterium]